MDARTNPLLDTGDLPHFAAIRPEHITPAVDALLSDANAALARATGNAVPADYDAMSSVLDVATERLTRAWAAVGHLHAVADTPELRSRHAENLSRVVEFHTRLGADTLLFDKYRAILAGPAAAGLSAPRRKALSNALRDFVLSGANLQGAAKERYAELQDRQAELSQQFSNHVLDATDSHACYVDEARLAGLPDDLTQAARQAAQADGREGCKVTLHLPSYLPVMQYVEDRSLREQLYRAYATRASEAGPPDFDNGAVMRELLELRQEEARLLGHANFAELSLVPKMAQSPAEVMQFLSDLGRRARPSAERDLADLERYAREQLGLDRLQAWDIAFVSERLKAERYAFSEQEVKQYFTVDKILDGLFRIVETLFEVRIVPDRTEVWHPSVRFFRIERSVGASTTLVGQFYLDLYARPGKRSGAWMDDVRDRWARPEGHLQTPVANLICNFTPPLVVDGVERQSLLTHDEVITLFHEFGHGLQLLLTRIDDLSVSGISGVEWDAVELPSQFMENFCWEWEVVRRLTAHVDTGEPLPRALFDRMLAARNFQSGLQTLRQVELSLIDMRLHAEPEASGRIGEVAAEVRQEVAVIRPPAFARPLHTFGHIFSGGYAAGYYSYQWAEVLSADAWSAFEEHAAEPQGVLDVATGRRYREQVLETGGSRTALESFTAFRGRAPRIDALLRHLGLADAGAAAAA
ncbi:MAG: M3 family metallopeptidase [Proteobacteria bacterium]|nr:M3 family metallopeptidase [Pseudomonadota bacterium]